MSECQQELCPNWSGDGRVCPCALFDLEPPADPHADLMGVSFTDAYMDAQDTDHGGES